MFRTIVLCALLAGTAWAGPPRPPGPPGPPGPPTPGLAPWPPGPPVSPEQQAEIRDQVHEHEDEILALVQEHDPDRYDQLLRTKGEDTTAYWSQLARVARVLERHRRDPESVQRAVEMQNRHRELVVLAADYASLSGKDQQERYDRMRALAAEIFDLKQVERRERLEEVERRMEELKSEIDDREKDREQIIEDYLDQLTRDRVDL